MANKGKVSYELLNRKLSEVSQKDYSTNEQYTGKKWIDGKKIYQKTFYINRVYTDVWNTDYKQILHNIENLSNIVSREAVLLEGKDALQLPITEQTYDENSGNSYLMEIMWYYADQGTIVIHRAAGHFNYYLDLYVTLYYTCTNR